MNTATGFTNGPKPWHGRAAINVDLEAAEPGVTTWRDFKWRFHDVDTAVQAGFVNMGDLPLDNVFRDFCCVHEDATRKAGTPRMNFFRHGENNFTTGAFFCRFGEITFEKLFAILVPEDGARVNKASGVRGKTEQFGGRATHRLKIDHLDADQRHTGAKAHDITVTRHLRRIIVHVIQTTAATGGENYLFGGILRQHAFIVVDAPGTDDLAVVYGQIDDGG